MKPRYWQRIYSLGAASVITLCGSTLSAQSKADESCPSDLQPFWKNFNGQPGRLLWPARKIAKLKTRKFI